jgi:ABC-type amino acid transport substrate-binding protein
MDKTPRSPRGVFISAHPNCHTPLRRQQWPSFGEGCVMNRNILACVSFVFALCVSASGAQAQAPDGRLKTIAAKKTIKIGYRQDATPFSFLNERTKQPAGYSLDICKSVVGSLQRLLKVQELKIEWVPVTVQNRFETVASGKADMECGSSTATLSRMKQVDFSTFIFVESTGLIVKASSGVNGFGDIGGKKIAVIAGTTNEKALNDKLKQAKIEATVVPVKNREEATEALEGGKVDAFASDKLLLVGMPLKDIMSYRILPDDLSFEPYGIVLPRGDWAMRLAVNSALAEIYTKGDIQFIFANWFGAIGLKAGPALTAMFVFGAIPE